jgi:hypothetical protein
MTEDDLDSLFASARGAAPRPSAGLTARVLADAEGLLAIPPAPPQPVARRSGLWAALAAAFGGSGALAGMATATVAGFYIGFAEPMDTGLVTSVLGGEIAELDMMPGIDALLDEAP